jgi:hypothetical protein
VPPLSTTDLVDESVPVLGLLAVYGLFATVSEYGIREIGSTGSIVRLFGRLLAVLFVVAAFGTLLVYVLGRGLALGEELREYDGD